MSLFVALALSFMIALGAFFGVTFARAAEDKVRTVTLSGSSIFIASNENAWIQAHKDGEGDSAKNYMTFAIDKDGAAINYRKNLAYKWVENTNEIVTTDADGKEVDTEVLFDNPAKGWFNMEVGFAEAGNVFDKFVITFESQQYTQTKDGKTTNYIVFEPAGDSQVKVYVLDKETDDENLGAVLARLENVDSLGTVANDHIKISFTKYENGNYTVEISDGTKTYTDKFENIGKTYSKYSSSTTTPVTPLSFAATFAEGKKDGDKALMTLYNLNGQSFEFTNDNIKIGEKITNGQVSDITPPVLCLDKAVPFIKYNGEIAFDYTVIDVLTSSPSLTTSYYMLTDKYVEDGTAPKYLTKTGGDYKEVSDSDNQYIFPHAKHYIPTEQVLSTTAFNTDDYEVQGAVKVVLKLTDTTSSYGKTTYVLLDWFVDDNYLIKIGEGENKVSYIAVTTDKQGLSYAYTKGTTSNPNLTGDNVNTEWKDIVDDYQKAVDKAAEGLKAGSKNYFYLPSVESLFNTDATPYEDLSFSIYYNNGSQQQSTGKSANSLSINLTKAGKYVFTVYARDAASNPMYYYKDNGEDGKAEATDLESSDIWNMFKQDKDSDFDGMRKYLPWFSFTVEESEISIEDPDEQSTAYVGSSFTADSFEINGVSVKTEYTLYEFRNDLWAKDNGGVAKTYEEFSNDVENLLLTQRKYFVKIRPTGDLKEGTADYDNFHAYGWNGSSLTFTPQTANAFYVIKCDASSSETAEPVTKCMTIAAAPKVAPLKGEDTWVQDNLTSIILLCIAGASLIGIILLLVIKPKNKQDIDEVIDTPKKKKKN
ncbi:MAG: hypothetical protein K2K38_05735 [Clostridia bacterium]|nr:hypothetical protein [Clostridia bacterium]